MWATGGKGRGSVTCLPPYSFRTKGNGDLQRVDVPQRIAHRPGLYQVISLLPRDNTFACGSLFMLHPGTKFIIFDVDGESESGWTRWSDMSSLIPMPEKCMSVPCLLGPRPSSSSTHTGRPSAQMGDALTP